MEVRAEAEVAVTGAAGMAASGTEVAGTEAVGMGVAAKATTCTANDASPHQHHGDGGSISRWSGGAACTLRPGYTKIRSGRHSHEEPACFLMS